MVFVTSTVFAQGPATPAAPAPAPAAPASAPAATPVTTPPSAGGQVDVSVKQLPTLTPQEMLNQGQAYFQSMNDTLKRIQVLEETAKRQKDIIKLNCVKDKLQQGKINLNL